MKYFLLNMKYKIEAASNKTAQMPEKINRKNSYLGKYT